MSKVVAIRADASPSLGAGHIVRCLALADALRASGAKIVFMCDADTPSTVPSLATFGHDLHILDGPRASEPAQMQRALPDGCDLLVVDHYEWQKVDEQSCRTFANIILVIEDLVGREHDCDFILDQAYGRDPSVYDDLVPASTERMMGARYVLLRPQFREYRDHHASAAIHDGQINKITICYGATDPKRVTVRTIYALDQMPDRFDITVIIGSASADLEAIEHAATHSCHNVNVLIDCQSMAEEFGAADLVFTACGSTIWELFAVGAVSASVQTSDNQASNAAIIQDQNLGFFLGDADQLTDHDLQRGIQNVFDHRASFSDIQRAVGSICDALGPRRVAQTVFPERAEGKCVTLKPATRDDSNVLYGWQSDPGMRQHFRNPAVPTRAEHDAWFSSKMSDPNCLLNIIYLDSEPVGVLRLDARTMSDADAPAYDVAILLADKARGMGVGTRALHLGRWLLPNAHLYAEVMDENTASKRLFTKAGYNLHGDWYIHYPETVTV